MRNEVKIGILAIVAIGLSIWGYKFIKGQNLLNSSFQLYAYYQSASGLTVGTPVTISGVSIGSVAAIELEVDKRLVLVVLDIEDEVPIPKDAIAYVVTTGIMGGKIVEIVYAQPCGGQVTCAEDGDYIEGREKGLLASFLGEGTTDQYIDAMKSGANSAIDSINQTLFGEDSNHPIANSSRDLEATMANLRAISQQMDLLLQRNSGNLNTTFRNLASLSTAIKQQEATIASILSNADSISQSLVDADLDQTIREVSASIAALKSTLESADESLQGLSSVVQQIERGEGTLGKLITDDQLYNRINRATLSIDTLATDLQERPYRYVPFKSRNRVKRFDRRDEKLEENGGVPAPTELVDDPDSGN